LKDQLHTPFHHDHHDLRTLYLAAKHADAVDSNNSG
jgi:hypothetical protein